MSMIDITANYHGGNQFSEAAHEAKEGSQKDRERIVALLANRGGLICEEIEDATGLGHQSASARLTELKRIGKVMVVGRRKTSRGRFAGINHLNLAVAAA